MSNSSRKNEKQGRKSVRQLTKVISHISKIEKSTNMPTVVPDSTEFKLALLNNGLTEEFVAEKLREAMEATTTKVDDKKGEVYVNADNTTRLKAIEMWVNIFGYKEINKISKKEGDKHVHIHGLSQEELDNAIRAASAREDKTEGS